MTAKYGLWAEKLGDIVTLDRKVWQVMLKDSVKIKVIMFDIIIDNLLQSIIMMHFLITMGEGELTELTKGRGKEADNFFKPSGPLGRLLNKAKFAYVLGFIDKTLFGDITNLHKIRNKFAHNTPIGFDDAKVCEDCNKLSTAKGQKFTDPNECSRLNNEARDICIDSLIELHKQKTEEFNEKIKKMIKVKEKVTK